MIAVVALVGCGKEAMKDAQPTASKAEVRKPLPPKVVPNSHNAKVAVERAIRGAAKKPKGELTKADLEQVEGFVVIFNQITDVSPLARLTNLKLLVLTSNKITDVTALGGLTQLRTLNLAGNQIKDVSPLAGLEQLKHLDLRKNPTLKKSEIEKLQKALPNCIIKHDFE
jgi:Leucine-rich repeat (LRR) protein